jgi:Putative prokaryotic signal transducing protein
MASDQAHDDEVVRLMQATNPADAHIVEQALRAEGISCRVVGDYLDASFGDLPGLQPEIWVHRRDLARAEQILQDLRNQAPPEADEPEA